MQVVPDKGEIFHSHAGTVQYGMETVQLASATGSIVSVYELNFKFLADKVSKRMFLYFYNY